ncbi:transcriptional regulator [Microtetraspora malaysiensis]|uniref:transcriptional regulator n=1 Tax=Microtetraspora malaysiensis TaxID=161358 RepID=UPI003D8F16D3
MTRPIETGIDLLILHTVRCCGYCGVARVAAATRLDEPTVESELIDLAVAGHVTRLSGAWGLTESGRAEDARRITDELETAGARPAVTAAYERFLELNPELLDLCTAWQLRIVDGVPTVNKHDDPSYDARVLDLFADLDRRLAPVCGELSAVLPRFARYPARLTEALDRATAGARELVTDDTASYHTVWAELHEDLLATLGIPR